MGIAAFASRAASGTGRVAAGGARAANIYQGIANSFPSIEDEAICTVYLQPGADKQQAYHLALSVCFGLVHRLDAFKGLAPPAGAIMIEYGGEPWVRATVRYRTSLLSAAIAAGGKQTALGNAASAIGNAATLELSSAWDNLTTALEQGGDFLARNGAAMIGGGANSGDHRYSESEFPQDLGLYKKLAVMSGPKTDHVLVGGPWSFTGALVPGLPADSQSAPHLPFAGRVIATADSHCYDPGPQYANLDPRVAPIVRSEAPRPPGDGRSRGAVRYPSAPEKNFYPGTFLVSMVYAALSNPGSAAGMTFPKPGTPSDNGVYL